MEAEEIRNYCLNKKGVTEGFPFDETTLVFKVGGKMFLLTQITQLKFFEISLWGNPKFRRTIFCVFW